jgi:hypothetical protein
MLENEYPITKENNSLNNSKKIGDLSQNENPEDKIRKYVFDIDSAQKRLTGRTPEKIEEETGISKDLIFPPDKKILYVGDPWQRMGREINDDRLTIIDYEYGEVASFVEDDEAFRENINVAGKNLLQRMENLKGWIENNDDKKWLESFYLLIKKACNFSEKINFYDKNNSKSAEEYKKAAKNWESAKNFIEEKYAQDKIIKDGENKGEAGDYENNDAFSEFRREVWYDCVYGERGFKDIPDWHNIVLSKLEKIIKEKEEKIGKKLDDEERNEIINKHKKRFIEEIRLKKRTDKANVVQGMFPDLPFKDGSFDRFVASWSISAHIFEEMNKEEFKHCWKEITRVLSKKGEAYIFPLGYYFDNEDNMIESLEEFEKNRKICWKLYNYNGEEIENIEDDIDAAYTLWLGKNN